MFKEYLWCDILGSVVNCLSLLPVSPLSSFGGHVRSLCCGFATPHTKVGFGGRRTVFGLTADWFPERKIFFICHLTLYTLMSLCMFYTDTSLNTFPKMQTRKNCSTVKSFLSWWSFLYSFPSIYTGPSQPLSRVVGYDSIIISKPCWMRAFAKFRTFSPDISLLLEVFLLN